MNELFNNKILKLIPIVFLIIIIIKILYTYHDMKDKRYEFAKKEAKVLKNYLMASREYSLGLFRDGIIELNENTLKAVPAFSTNIISKTFSENNPFDIVIKTVSDNPRNINNLADKDELKAIKYFNDNIAIEEYFSDKNDKYYQYASTLKIDNNCLKCHGEKENAPKFIQDTYDSAYDYKLGELKGIISIKLPLKNLNTYFIHNFIKSVVYDLILFFLLFIGINYIVKKSKKINRLLEAQVKEKTKEVKNLLLYDRLTLLPNRLKLIEDLTNNTGTKHLALINIDRFKDINDLYGYEVGDEILNKVAQSINNLSQENITVYKLPADEFAIFTTVNISEIEFLQSIKKLIHLIQEIKFEIKKHSIFITLSSGIACNDKSLIIKASSALQTAKNSAKNIVIYDKSLDTKKQIILNNCGILMLKNAIRKNNITPFFQPIYNINTKKIEKFESLARIILDNGYVVAPIGFLDIAKKSKLYPEITKAMVRKSFDYFKDKQYEFSLNISLLDIENKTTFAYILNAVKKFPEPKRIIFEIIESDKIEDYKKLNVFIKKVKEYGCKVAIDDFGSGYSNFSHLFSLNVDYLKIDSSLVKNVTTDENSKVITRTIINFASSLGLKTIAEYVEDKKSLELLEKMGIDFIQGYYIGKPEADII
ncbi:MAG: EAL domain-containing protein [Sulfurimonas sp.]|nr:EAL domain-containing protein [Sulfurimonas sp.]